MKKHFFSLLLLCIGCCACHTGNQPAYYEGTFQAVSEMARQQNKPLWMILGGGKNCMACEKLLENMAKEGVFDDFREDYIFYRCNVEHPANTFLKYIFLMESIPNSYILSPEGKMVSFYAGNLQAGEIRQLLTAAKEGNPLYPPRHSQFKSTPEKLLDLQNLLLATYPEYKKAGGDTHKLKEILPDIQKSIMTEPYFYNLYIAARIYRQLGDSIQANQYAGQALQICPDGFQTIVYRPLIAELQKFHSRHDSLSSFARLVFEQKQLEIQDKAQGQYVFRFKNTGTQPLIIKHVSTSCSCATPEWKRNPVSPGGKGEIKIHYQANKDKAFNKTFWVQSNAINSIESITIQNPG
ncbi:MAG: DUF1573 domain-containing protein [Odoribacter sp.]|nr:DUF1573 domain-containing protein [Odoribacter sp.]